MTKANTPIEPQQLSELNQILNGIFHNVAGRIGTQAPGGLYADPEKTMNRLDAESIVKLTKIIEDCKKSGTELITALKAAGFGDVLDTIPQLTKMNVQNLPENITLDATKIVIGTCIGAELSKLKPLATPADAAQTGAVRDAPGNPR